MVCFFACGIWCVADVSSVSLSSEQIYSLRKKTPFLPPRLRFPDERKRASAIWAEYFRQTTVICFMVIRTWTASKWMLIQSSCWILASTMQTLPDVFGWTFRKSICLLCRGVLKQGNPIKNEKSCGDRVWVKFDQPIDFPFWLVGEKRGSVEMSLNF